MSWLKVVEALKAPVGTELTLKGWVRTRRHSKADGGLSFITVHDGTCQDPIQVVVRSALWNYLTDIQRLSTGCAVEVDGTLVASQGKGQALELLASAVRVVGWVDDPVTSCGWVSSRRSFSSSAQNTDKPVSDSMRNTPPMRCSSSCAFFNASRSLPPEEKNSPPDRG